MNKNAQQALSDLSDMFGIGGKDMEEEDVFTPEEEADKSVPLFDDELPEDEERPVTAKEARVTVISEGMLVKGNIENTGDIEIYGTVEGNVTGHNIHIFGRVCGDITAFSLTLQGAEVKGNVASENDIVIDENSVVTDGTLTAKSMCCNSRLIGDITLSGHLYLENKACVEGNVTCKSIRIDEGAVIRGVFNCTNEK